MCLDSNQSLEDYLPAAKQELITMPKLWNKCIEKVRELYELLPREAFLI
ncbi:MAG: hypothetical protein AB8V23_03285 [Candidatus Midichloria sp.]|uniref:Uncharacterized protein n=1 Tax=Hyalomma marginatum TaxID=34627 RepID=A0A8S4C1P0_9ACAR|nr:hypothetical protein MHYMCMPASI_00536 [Hyalomma marginatum]CAG7592944.1 hypothetical protein MHYMCMPSP_00761 [Hyalomma marginatum]